MPNTVSIGIAQPEATIEINADPVLASNVTPRLTPGASFTPAPNQFAELKVETSPYTTVTSPYEEAAIGGISFQQPVNINVGETVSSLVPDLLTAYVYKFDNFTMPLGIGSLTRGDIVCFTPAAGFNSYNSVVQQISISDVEAGAKKSLFIFISYDSNERLTVMHKGYFEPDVSKITSWDVGATLYPNDLNKFSTSPTSTSGNWVRSLGFCIPNTQNKKFIWFEPDTTYLKLL